MARENVHKINKRTAQVIHAKRRFRERYNRYINRNDYNKIIKLISTKKATLIYEQSLRISVWKILWKNQDIYGVYDKSRKSIVTFLTKPMIDKDITGRNGNVHWRRAAEGFWEGPVKTERFNPMPLITLQKPDED